ncbi:hypothetical protein ACWC5I_16970 [Kitasatospora sp. NPDC001574]
MHADAAGALTEQRITIQPPAGQVQLATDGLQRVWLSLGEQSGNPRSRYDLADRIVTALTSAGLSLTSSTHPQADDLTDRLAGNEPLLVRRP